MICENCETKTRCDGYIKYYDVNKERCSLFVKDEIKGEFCPKKYKQQADKLKIKATKPSDYCVYCEECHIGKETTDDQLMAELTDYANQQAYND